MSTSNCYFLTCIQTSQGQIKWSGIPISWKIFQSLLWSTQSKALFGIVNKAEADVFLELSCFLNYSLSILWHCLSLGLEWKLTVSSPVATAEFSKFAGILSAALSQHHPSGFEVAQLGPLSPLASFVVMLPKAHLTSHSKMSGSRWVITQLWLLGCEDLFCIVFCVFLPPLLNIFCSVRSIQFLSFTVIIFAWNIPLVTLTFLKRSLVFPILLFSSISLHWSLRKASLISSWYSLEFCIQIGISFLFSFAFCFFSFHSYL